MAVSLQHFRSSGTGWCLHRRNLGEVQPWLNLFMNQWNPKFFLCFVTFLKNDDNRTLTSLPSHETSLNSCSARQTIKTENKEWHVTAVPPLSTPPKACRLLLTHQWAGSLSNSILGYANHRLALPRRGREPRQTPSLLLATRMVKCYKLGKVCPQSLPLTVSVAVPFLTVYPFSLCQERPFPY